MTSSPISSPTTTPIRPRLDKAAFFRDLGYTPHPGQIEIHRSGAPRRVVACGVRWGKTVASAMEGLAAAMEPAERSVGWVAAPTYDLCDRVFREIQYIASRHLADYVVSMKDNDRRLVLRNLGGGLSEIRGKSADNPVSLLGEGLNWLIVDEAARLKPSIWQSHLSQRLVDKPGAWALLISTPRGKGWYFDVFRRGRGQDADFKSWNYPSATNPHLDATLIEAERSRLPERVFREQYLAEFLEGSGSVFRYVREAATGDFVEPIRGKRYVIGLDLAKIEDFTVAVVMNMKRQVVFLDRYHRQDWAVMLERIKAVAKRYHNAAVYVDSTGSGEPIYEQLCRSGIDAHAYGFTSKTKAALIDQLVIALERRKLVLPKPEVCPELIDELEGFEFSVTEGGTVRTGAPSGMHDDCVIALGLALHGWNNEKPCHVQVADCATGPRIPTLGESVWPAGSPWSPYRW